MKVRKLFLNRLLGFVLLAFIFISTITPVASYDFSLWRKETGPQNVFVITVHFADKQASIKISDIKNLIFTEMDSYYRTVSYGKVSIIGDITEKWILLPQNMSHYGNYDNRNLHSKGARALIRDAIKNSDAYIDFSAFDYVLVVHAGKNEAYSNEVNDIWSWGFWEGLQASTEEGEVFNQGAVVSEFADLGTFCHEFGHILGLPDLYNSDFNSTKKFVEKWGLMGYGHNNGDPMGSQPSHILAWGKMFLGWINDSQIFEIKRGTIEQSINITIETLEKFTSGIKVIKISILPKYYYLIEIRIDDNLPQQGLLITLVNETKNSGEDIVEVIDSNPITPTLNDAIFHTGDFFEETQNHFTLKVLEKFEDSSYTLEFAEKLFPYINISAPSKIKAYQGIQIKVEIVNFNGIPLEGLTTTLFVNGKEDQMSKTDAKGIATFYLIFDLFEIGNHSIEIHVDGGDFYIDNQIEHILEVQFPFPLILFAFVIFSFLIIVLAAYIITRAESF